MKVKTDAQDGPAPHDLNRTHQSYKSCTTIDDVLGIFTAYPAESFTARQVSARLLGIKTVQVTLDDCNVIYSKLRRLRKGRYIQLDGLEPVIGFNSGLGNLRYRLRT